MIRKRLILPIKSCLISIYTYMSVRPIGILVTNYSIVELLMAPRSCTPPQVPRLWWFKCQGRRDKTNEMSVALFLSRLCFFLSISFLSSMILAMRGQVYTSTAQQVGQAERWTRLRKSLGPNFKTVFIYILFNMLNNKIKIVQITW